MLWLVFIGNSVIQETSVDITLLFVEKTEFAFHQGTRQENGSKYPWLQVEMIPPVWTSDCIFLWIEIEYKIIFKLKHLKATKAIQNYLKHTCGHSLNYFSSPVLENTQGFNIYGNKHKSHTLR